MHKIIIIYLFKYLTFLPTFLQLLSWFLSKSYEVTSLIKLYVSSDHTLILFY
jgi:hypothetical protein